MTNQFEQTKSGPSSSTKPHSISQTTPSESLYAIHKFHFGEIYYARKRDYSYKEFEYYLFKNDNEILKFSKLWNQEIVEITKEKLLEYRLARDKNFKDAYWRAVSTESNLVKVYYTRKKDYCYKDPEYYIFENDNEILKISKLENQDRTAWSRGTNDPVYMVFEIENEKPKRPKLWSQEIEEPSEEELKEYGLPSQKEFEDAIMNAAKSFH